MNVQILFNDDARKKMFEGVEELQMQCRPRSDQKGTRLSWIKAMEYPTSPKTV